MTSLNEAVRQSLHSMAPVKYEFQSEFAKRYLAEGEAKVLLKQLALKFGPLSDAVTERVKGASPAELDVWTSRVLTAPTLDEVLR